MSVGGRAISAEVSSHWQMRTAACSGGSQPSLRDYDAYRTSTRHWNAGLLASAAPWRHLGG